jgi:hypothetical protein
MRTRAIRFVPLFIALALLFALLPACQKKKAPVVETTSESNDSGDGYSDETDSDGTDSGESEAGDGEYSEGENADDEYSGGQGSESLSGSFIIRTGAGLYEKGDDGLKWKDSLGIGQSVQVTGGSSKAKIEKNEYEVLPVTLESGSEGYVIAQYVAADATLGAVVSDLATLYKRPKDTAVLATIVPIMTIVATYPAEGGSDFYKIVGYDSATGERYADRYLAASDVSVQGSDVNAALLMFAIKGVSKKEQKRKLINTILTKYPASAFSGKVQELQIALEPEKMGTVPMAGEYVATESGTIRDIPSVFGASVKKLAKDDAVTAVEATTEKFTIGEESAPWVRVSAPAAGWVFGQILAAKR